MDIGYRYRAGAEIMEEGCSLAPDQGGSFRYPSYVQAIMGDIFMHVARSASATRRPRNVSASVTKFEKLADSADVCKCARCLLSDTSGMRLARA